MTATSGAYLYILRCSDGSYYVGTTTGNLEERVAQHQTGALGGYTALRRPVQLVFHHYFDRLDDAATAERQVKGWRREKKEALIRGDYAALPALARRRASRVHPSSQRTTHASSVLVKMPDQTKDGHTAWPSERPSRRRSAPPQDDVS